MSPAESKPQEVLRDEIIADAEKQAKRIARRAGRDADATRKKAREEADRIRTEQLDEARRRADHVREMTLARVPVDAGRMRDERIEAILDEIRAAAADRLAERDGFDYAGALADLAAAAIDAMPAARFTLKLAPADADLGDELVRAVRERSETEDIDLSVDTREDSGPGLRVRDDDGRRAWDETFEARLERLWPAMRRRIGQAVTGRAESGERAPDEKRLQENPPGDETLEEES